MGIKLVKLQAIEIINLGPSIKDVPKRGGGGQGEKDTNVDMGRGVKQGWTSTFGKKIEVQYCSVTKSFYRGKGYLMAKRKV